MGAAGGVGGAEGVPGGLGGGGGVAVMMAAVLRRRLGHPRGRLDPRGP